MDVRCEKCQTEYEFDDALVTGKGTSVKCTQCGHQFRVQGAGVDDRWVIESETGSSHTFTSMRELQRAIASRLVAPGDLLVRNGSRRPLGSIIELVPFFDEQPRAHAKTLSGVEAPPSPHGSAASPLATTHFTEQATGHSTKGNTKRPPPIVQLGVSTDPVHAPPTVRDPNTRPPPANHTPAAPAGMNNTVRLPAVSQPPPVPMRSRTATLRPQEGVAPPPMPHVKRLKDESQMRQSNPPPPPFSDDDVDSGRSIESASALEEDVDRAVLPMGVLKAPRPPPPDIDFSTPLPPVGRAGTSVPVSKAARSAEVEEEEEEDDAAAPNLSEALSRREGGRRYTGFVVALLLIGVVVGGGAYWMKTHPTGASTAETPASSPTLDPRAQEYLSAGERALSEGNLELSKEKLDKASALAEKDPRVLGAVARLDGARAEVPWLRLRILPPEAKDDLTVAKHDLEDTVTRAKASAEAASAADPTNVAALRAKVDAYRLAGDKAKYQAFTRELAGKPKDSETAFVLAMVDLAEPDSVPLPTTITRLREATEVDGSGRSRAALVYALALSGDPASARMELDRLTARERPHPLAAQLRAFIARAPSKVAATGDGGLVAMGPQPGPVASGGGTSTGGGAGAGGGGGADVPLTGDSRALVGAGDNARAKGDLGRAKKAYETALEKNPYDSEALAGLGEVAHKEGDLAGAKQEFKRAIAVNPRFLPALVGLGDVEWESGNQAAAQRIYKEITDNYPDVAYPGRVKERSETKAAPPTPPTPEPDKKEPPPPTTAAPQLTVPATAVPASSGAGAP